MICQIACKISVKAVMNCRLYVSWSGKTTKWSGKCQGKVREFCEGSWLDTLLVNGSSLQIQIQIFHVEGFEIQIQNSAYLNTNINSNTYLTPALPQLCWSVSPCPHPPLWLGTMIMISLFCLSDWWKCCAAAQWQRIIRIRSASRATGARETWLPGIPHGY